MRSVYITFGCVASSIPEDYISIHSEYTAQPLYTRCFDTASPNLFKGPAVVLYCTYSLLHRKAKREKSLGILWGKRRCICCVFLLHMLSVACSLYIYLIVFYVDFMNFMYHTGCSSLRTLLYCILDTYTEQRVLAMQYIPKVQYKCNKYEKHSIHYRKVKQCKYTECLLYLCISSTSTSIFTLK